MPERGQNIVTTLLAQGADSDLAIIHGDDAINYQELRKRVNEYAGVLIARGHNKGDRIGIMADNSIYSVVAYLAIMRGGFVAVPLQTNIPDSSLKAIIDTTSMQSIFVQRKYCERVYAWAENDSLTVFIDSQTEGHFQNSNVKPIQDLVSEGTTETAYDTVNPETDLAALVFTSGSTGLPKGVMVSHRNIECNTDDIVSYVGLRSNDRAMIILPLYYCFATSLLHSHLMVGASVVINNDFIFPERVLDDLDAKQCTGIAGVPSTFQILLRKTHFKQRRFPSLQWIQQAGGKLSNPFIREIRETFPSVRFFLMYGQTEATARLSYLPPEKLDEKLGSIGKGLRNTKLEVIKNDGSVVIPGSDEIGEIVAEGENITLGYWNDPGETARFFSGNRLRTGDMARVDKDGYIYIVDRARDFIKSMGNRVSSKEVEEIIAEMPEVVEVAVIGVPDDILGEAIKAFVVPRSIGVISNQGIKDYCIKHLPTFKIPRRIEIREALPKTESGKIAKSQLS